MPALAASAFASLLWRRRVAGVRPQASFGAYDKFVTAPRHNRHLRDLGYGNVGIDCQAPARVNLLGRRGRLNTFLSLPTEMHYENVLGPFGSSPSSARQASRSRCGATSGRALHTALRKVSRNSGSRSARCSNRASARASPVGKYPG